MPHRSAVVASVEYGEVALEPLPSLFSPLLLSIERELVHFTRP